MLRIVRIILSKKKKKIENNYPNLKLVMYINIMYLKIWLFKLDPLVYLVCYFV